MSLTLDRCNICEGDTHDVEACSAEGCDATMCHECRATCADCDEKFCLDHMAFRNQICQECASKRLPEATSRRCLDED